MHASQRLPRAQVQELRQRFSSWLVQVVRLYEDQDVIEFAWEVGPVPMDDNKGKELVSRFESSVRSGNRFYSDTNGRRSIERRLGLLDVGCPDSRRVGAH